MNSTWNAPHGFKVYVVKPLHPLKKNITSQNHIFSEKTMSATLSLYHFEFLYGHAVLGSIKSRFEL